MNQTRARAGNVIGWVLYALLLPAGALEFFSGGMIFGMSTDACHDAACDARFHPDAAIGTLLTGIVVVLIATFAMMVLATRWGRSVLPWPFLGLIGLAAVGAIAFSIVGY